MMKNILTGRIFNTVLLICLCIIFGGTISHADDTINIVFTTTNAGGSYGDRHIHVVWLAAENGEFISTAGTNQGNERAVWANRRKDSFYTWWTSARQEDIDARTGATQTAYKTYNLNWDFRKLDGTVIPDGTYRLYFECTNSDSGLPRNFTYVTITKGRTSWSIGPVSQGGYNNITLTYTPEGLGVKNTGAVDVTSQSARLTGEVTGTEGEDPEVFVYWGKEDGGTNAANWDNFTSLGILGIGEFSANISNLEYGQKYYYRCYVQDSIMGVWATTTDSFEAGATVIFQEGDYWKYDKGYTTPNNWNVLNFSERGWFTGRTGIGYEDGDDNTILEDMAGNYLTVYMRYTFWVDYPEKVTDLTFTVDYDDGFVAFINGTEVARRGVPEGQKHSTEASDHEAGVPEVLNLSAYTEALLPGNNVFAIEIHNSSINSSDLSMIPELVMTGGLSEPQPDIAVSPDELNYSEVAVGTYSDLIFGIENLGDLSLQIQSIEITGFDKEAYTIVSGPAIPSDLDPGSAQLQTTIRFAPSAAGKGGNATVAIGSNDPDTPVASISLNGKGTRTYPVSLATQGSVGGECRAVAIAYPYVLLGQGATLNVVNASQSSAPSLTGQVHLSDMIHRVAIDGSIAYVAAGSSGIYPVNIESLSSPVALAPVEAKGYAYDPAVSGDTLCVADGWAGLSIYDISNPLSPVYKSSFAVDGSIVAVAMDGTKVYALDDMSGLYILDVAASPVLLGDCNEIELGQAVTVFGTNTYITDRLGNLYVVDVSNPANPYVRSELLLPAFGHSLAIEGGKLYVAAGQKLLTVDITNPDLPELLSQYETTGFAYDVAINQGLAYMADGLQGLSIISTPNQNGLSKVGSLAFVSTPYTTAVGGSFAPVAAGRLGLQMMDISDPASPTIAASLESMLEGDLYKDEKIDFADFTLLAKEWMDNGSSLVGDILPDNTVNAFDLSVLAENWLKTETLDEVRDIALSDQLAFLALGNSGLQIVDLSNPALPVLLGDYHTKGPAGAVAISGNITIIADGTNLYVLDVTYPFSPSLLMTWASDGWIHDVKIQPPYIYVANGGMGLQVLSLDNLSEVSTYDTPGVAYAVTVADGVAYLADGSTGVQILNVGNPSAPILISSYDVGATAVDVALAGSILYVAQGRGLSLVDISNPALPAPYAYSEETVRVLSISVSGQNIIVSDHDGGLIIMNKQH